MLRVLRRPLLCSRAHAGLVPSRPSWRGYSGPARKVVLARALPPEARKPEDADFRIVDAQLPSSLPEGHVLYEVKALSADPGYLSVGFEEGEGMPGYGMIKVLESKHPSFLKGQSLLMWKPVPKAGLHTGSWRTHGMTDGSDLWKMPDGWKGTHGEALAMLGPTAVSAYTGLKHILEAKAGQTLFVNAAAGACGNVVGQLGKAMGCRVLGSCGSAEKAGALKKLGFDAVINYKALPPGGLTAALEEAAPEGIDLFWDNVGGRSFGETLLAMNDRGRVCKCGQVAEQVGGGEAALEKTSPITWKQLRIEGFLDHDRFLDETGEAMATLAGAVAEGKLVCSLSEYEGLKRAPHAFAQLFEGGNMGKSVVNITPECARS